MDDDDHFYSDNEKFISFWRPQAPPGYAIFGDILLNCQMQCTNDVFIYDFNK